MSAQARTSYFETQILTATPQKLRLMLLDGAIRLARQTLAAWEAGRNDEAFESLSRCRGIVAELLSGVRPDGTALTKRVSALYVFLFRWLGEAQLRRDAGKLSEALSVLEIERDTWQQLCEQMPATPESQANRGTRPEEISAAGMTAILPTSSGQISGPSGRPMRPASQLSLEG